MIHLTMVQALQLTMPIAGLVFIICVIILGITDLVLVAIKGTVSSVSQFLINVGFLSPMTDVTFGVIIGHLFCYMYVPNGDPTNRPYHMLFMGLAGGFIAGWLGRYFYARNKP